MLGAETVGIAIGLALALGIFSFKTAVGIYYLTALPCSALRKGIILAILWGSYCVLFPAAFLLIEKIDLFQTAGNATAFLNAGILFHLLLCTGLIVWGTKLLIAPDASAGEKPVSYGWILLAVPCPVCASAVLLVCAFAAMLFPESLRIMRRLIPAFFLFSNFLFLLLLHAAGRFFRLKPLALTGGAMILIALYFFLILIAAPVMNDAGKLYSAACAASGFSELSWKTALVCGSLLFAGTAGFILKYSTGKGD